MKARLSLGAVLVIALLFAAAPASAQNHQLLQGTQIRMTLQNGLSTSVARDGDPFTAIVSQPVMIGNLVVLPAGARINGTISNINRPKHFNMFRGQASMNLTFHSIEIDHREYPVQMSLLALTESSGNGTGSGRKDVKIQEGTVIQEKRDAKGTVVALALGMGGGSAVGAIFSNVLRGFIIGTVGSVAYVVAKKGKEVELPAQTGMLVRMDNTIEIPPMTAAMIDAGALQGQP